VWWVWNATPIGPIAATAFSTFWNLVAFMSFHYVSKRAHKSVAYTLLIVAWVATEYLYTHAEVLSFPWLVLGNGFSGEVWAVRWYEFTGVMGGSLWVVMANVAIYEAWQNRYGWSILRAALVVVAPIILSLVLYFGHDVEPERVQVAVAQPNVDCYAEKFNNSARSQLNNMLSLLKEASAESSVVLFPETALPETLDEDNMEINRSALALKRAIQKDGMVVTGVTSIRFYDGDTPPTQTARMSASGYYDYFNSALALGQDGEQNLHHKMRLVIGVEAMPFTGLLNKFVDLGGITGQLGRNDKAAVFEKHGVKFGPAICYEGLYGECFARFVGEGANVMLVMSNDGWWGNTPGHKRLFDFCRLRAIETRRAVARSANTGVSGFISSRGDVEQRLDWDQRGLLQQEVEVRHDKTIYSTYGDWVGRMSLLISFLTLLYYSAYRVRRKNHLVD
jgi:apolipoprotein N-acyltransferase